MVDLSRPSLSLNLVSSRFMLLRSSAAVTGNGRRHRLQWRRGWWVLEMMVLTLMADDEGSRPETPLQWLCGTPLVAVMVILVMNSV
ncbi:hypothetical protein Hanom_Chr16g01468021 [Helianthus anomalus]